MVENLETISAPKEITKEAILSPDETLEAIQAWPEPVMDRATPKETPKGKSD